MTGYIVEKYNFMNNAYTSARLVEEGKKAGMDMRIIGVCDTFDNGTALINSGEVLHDAELVINRYKYGNLKNKIAALGRRSFNAVEKIDQYVDKSRQRGIYSAQMTHPRSLLAVAGVPFDMIEAAVGLPFVAKGLCGSQGNMVHLVEDAAQYAVICTKYKDTELLFQQFIKTSFGRDLRMLSIRGEVVGCMCREAKSGFRANFALGADVRAYPADNAVKQIAADIYKQTGTDILGIDLLFGSDGYVFCEINVTPGIEGIEKACGCNAAAAVTALGKAK